MKGSNQMCLWRVWRSPPSMYLESRWFQLFLCYLYNILTWWETAWINNMSPTCLKECPLSSVLRPRDTSPTCTRTSEMDTTSSPCWRCSPERHWWAPGDLWPSDIRTSASAVTRPDLLFSSPLFCDLICRHNCSIVPSAHCDRALMLIRVRRIISLVSCLLSCMCRL